MSLRTGAQQPHINKGTVENTYLAIPPQEILEAYYEYTNSIYEDILTATQEAAKRMTVEDFSMPKLMIGQVTVE